ncbi:hypothetical protein WMY93_007303 [Mugilogobius chulae]|uniref:PWWP domain containing 2A n=1 Tax=Mugilogobius chulae TaxID=88201 RepID=A0AAW0PCJ6_9GOBI
MAAVAREPGAAAVLTVPPPEPRPPDPARSDQNLPNLNTEPPGPRLCAALSDKDEDRRHVSPEANANEANANDSSPELAALLRDSAAGKQLSEHGPAAEQDPVQSAVSRGSGGPEAGLSLGQPNGPDRACTERTITGSPERYTALRGEAAEEREEEHREEDREEDPGQHQAVDPPHDSQPGSELQPGTQVRVSLDHVIDDALVVSFRVGPKVFSGVLMDVSRRFGPYGIPVTAFPSRRESSRRHVQAPPTVEAPPPAEAPPTEPALTPLFHQGAPYPPPLFLRDSYHQSLPQPPPRRIKRSRRRYGNSEEPTCMLVRLRPRQVLCDRCKGVAGPRPAPSTRRRPIQNL